MKSSIKSDSVSSSAIYSKDIAITVEKNLDDNIDCDTVSLSRIRDPEPSITVDDATPQANIISITLIYSF